MTSIIERLSYIPCLPTVKAGSSGRYIVDYAVSCAVANIFVRDLITFPEGRHGIFTKEELKKAVCAEVRPDFDVYNSIDETEFVVASVEGLIDSNFLQEDSDGNLSCTYISRLLVNLWNGQGVLKEMSEGAEDLEEIPELF